MDTRKSFLQKGALAAATIAASGELELAARVHGPMKTNQPGKGLVLWYSQSGNTRRYGRLIAKIWEKEGLDVIADDIRNFDVSKLTGYDLIAIGSPVFNYTVPVNVKTLLSSIPSIKGTPVASFVSFGGPEGNQHNTGVKLLNMMADKGGVPVGMEAFMNMGTMPITNWEKAPGTIKHRHLPDQATYERVRAFARSIITNVNNNRTIEYSCKATAREFATAFPIAGIMKVLYNKHVINKDTCIGCGTCVEKCPVGAIDISTHSINRKKCIECCGCINNCPTQAVEVEYMGKKVIGFPALLKKNGITVHEPPELMQDGEKKS